MSYEGPCDLTSRGRGARSGYGRRWRKERGPVPEGYELHHLCEDNRCRNLDHIVMVTRAEHMQLDGRAGPDSPATKARRAITRCAQGHDLTPENTGWNRHAPPRAAQRYCRTCRRDAQRRRREVVMPS
jgi:hypothetical protein